MYRSLARHCREELRLFALCLDDEAFKALSSLGFGNVVPIAMTEFEAGDADLGAAKQNRSRMEYYFTCTPSLLLHVFDQYPDVDRLTYVDADLYFFASVGPVLDEMKEGSVLIIPHRFSARWRKYERTGKYNVSLLSFRREEESMRCLTRWRECCIEWCYDRCEDGKFADQKYLDEWPTTFEGVREVEHRGANVGPWNIEDYHVTRKHGTLMVEDVRLVFYHFEGYRQIASDLVDPGLASEGYELPATVIRHVHLPYVQEVLRAKADLANVQCLAVAGWGNGRAATPEEEHLSRLYRFRLFVEGHHIWCFAGRAWYCDCSLARSIVRAYDRLRGR